MRRIAVPALCLALWAQLVPGAAAQSNFRLDCDDASGPTEDEVNPAFAGPSSTEVYTCKVTNTQGGPVFGITVRAEVMDVVNDPDSPDGQAVSQPTHVEYGSADYQCSSDSSGTCTIPVTQREAEVGTTRICFRTDTPDTSGCFDEPWDEAISPAGTDVANDGLDSTVLMWEASGPVASRLDTEADSAASPVPGTQTVTAKVYDQFGNPFSGNTTVKLVFMPGSPSFTSAGDVKTCSTGGTSTCSFTWSQSQPGTDYLCTYLGNVWWMRTNSTLPTMCEDDRLYDLDDEAGVFDVPSVADRIDVVRMLWGDAGRVDCDDPSGDTEHERRYDSDGAASTIVYTCATEDAQREPLSPGTTVFGEALGGANDPDDGTSYGSPDYSCVVGSNGACQVPVAQSDLQAGTLDLCFYLYVATAPARCAESIDAPDRTTTLGGIVDSADTVRAQWIKRSALGSITLAPQAAVLPVGTKHTLTVSIYDEAGAPLADQTIVKFELFAGSPGDLDGTTFATPDRTCTTTQSSASCSIAFTSTVSGRDVVCAWINHEPVVAADGTTCRSGGFPDNLHQEDQKTATVTWSKPKGT